MYQQQINRSWLAVQGAYIAVDCIAAFVPSDENKVGTVVFLKGGHTVDVPMSVAQFVAALESTNG